MHWKTIYNRKRHPKYIIPIYEKENNKQPKSGQQVDERKPKCLKPKFTNNLIKITIVIYHFTIIRLAKTKSLTI